MIPKSVVEDILAATRIEEIIEKNGVKLSKKGSNYTGLCPFHNEKTPSFSVSPGKGIYKCFGCGEAGDSIKFLMKKHQYSYPEAVKTLAKDAHIIIEEKELTPEEKKQEDEKLSIYAANRAAQKIFMELEDGPGKEYILHRHSKTEIDEFGIGFSKSGYTEILKKQGFSETILEASGLSKIRGEKLQDYFISRVTYPIYTISGEIVGFTGRRLDDDDKYVKYLNTSDTSVFHKSKSLYGIFNSLGNIIKTGRVTIVEGSTDVISAFPFNVNPVAGLGTSFTPDHVKLVAKYLKSYGKNSTVTIIGDGDAAGEKMLIKVGRYCIKENLNTYIVKLDKGEDPDSWFKKIGLDQEIPEGKSIEEFRIEYAENWIQQNKMDYILWIAQEELNDIKGDPSQKLNAIDSITELLSMISDERKASVYVNEIVKISKVHGITKKQIEDSVKRFRKEEESENTKFENRTDSNGLPEYITKDAQKERDYWKYGFYEGEGERDLNKYFFGNGESVSNFIIVPIFHIRSVGDSRKLFILKNSRNEISKIDVEIGDFTSVNVFRKILEGTGNYVFEGDDRQFIKIRKKLYDNTKYCNKIDNLGWQKQGFWAWANGTMVPNSSFVSIDDDGVVEFEKQFYYIAPFSGINLHDKTIYTTERKFRFIPNNEVTFYQWTEQYIKVFGDNGMIAITFGLAAIFRDFILGINKNFPTLNAFGPIGTGKTHLAKCLSYLFGEQQQIVNLNNTTQAAIATHLEQFYNGIAIFDEYKNSIDLKILESMKGIYDGTGRVVNGSGVGKSKKTTNVNQAAIICGQEMLTLDVALLSRVIFLQFYASERTEQERIENRKLEAMQEKGLSHLTNQLIFIRDHFEENFYINLKEAENYIQENTFGISERIIRNWATLLATFITVNDKIKLAIETQHLRSFMLKSVEIQQRQTTRSNEVTRFWEIIDSLHDSGEIEAGWHFNIKYIEHIITPKTDENDKFIVQNFGTAKKVILIKMNALAEMYTKAMRQNGDKPLAKDTLTFYLENQKYFLGVSRVERFEHSKFNIETKQVEIEKNKTSAYCFDYEQLTKFDINLEKESEAYNKPTDSQGQYPGQMELPDF